MIFGSLLLIQTLIHNIFLLHVSIQPYTAIGKVLFWYPISLSWPSRECTQFEPRDVKLLLGFFFLNWGALSSRATGSTLYITAYTTSRGTFSSWTCLSFLCKALYPRSLPGPSISCLTAVSISPRSTLRSVYRILKYSSRLSRDQRGRPYTRSRRSLCV